MPGKEPQEAEITAERVQAVHRAATTTELRAMDAAFDALYKLDYSARRRALCWLEEALQHPPVITGADDEPPF